jgi:hypothetical protein
VSTSHRIVAASLISGVTGVPEDLSAMVVFFSKSQRTSRSNAKNAMRVIRNARRKSRALSACIQSTPCFRGLCLLGYEGEVEERNTYNVKGVKKRANLTYFPVRS